MIKVNRFQLLYHYSPSTRFLAAAVPGVEEVAGLEPGVAIESRSLLRSSWVLASCLRIERGEIRGWKIASMYLGFSRDPHVANTRRKAA